MIRYENQCCDCAAPGYPCMGDSCSRRHTPIYICDKCEEETDELRDVDGEQLCLDCLLEMFPVIE